MRKKAIRANHAWFQQGESLATTQTVLGRILPNAASEETTYREAERRRRFPPIAAPVVAPSEARSVFGIDMLGARCRGCARLALAEPQLA